MKIAIILGGSSSEREISILTGLSVSEAISKKFDVEVINIKNDLSILPQKLLGVDIVFNALHGGIGENGDIQSFLDLHQISYCGSGPKASKTAMNKHLSKMVAKSVSVPTPDWVLLNLYEDSVKRLNLNSLRLPFIMKPSDEGSTVGLSLVKDECEIEDAIELAGKHSSNILAEEYIPGREVTVGILDSKPLPIVEIIPDNELYDHECKYTSGKSKYQVPAELPENITRKIQSDALKIYNSIGCKHYARVDFRLNKDEHYFLEINTLPGMTATSLFPMAAKAAGLDFVNLIETIIKIAMDD